MRDTRGGCHISALADFYRRHQGCVASNEGSVLDHRLMFMDAVVVTRDRARSDIHARSDLCVAKVGEVVGFGWTGFGEIKVKLLPFNVLISS